MKQTGVTPEGKPVYDGVFKLYDTHGLPLDVTLHALRERGAVVDWLDLFESARRAGWKDKKILAWCEQSLRDSLDPDADEIMLRLGMLPKYIEIMSLQRGTRAPDS